MDLALGHWTNYRNDTMKAWKKCRIYADKNNRNKTVGRTGQALRFKIGLHLPLALGKEYKDYLFSFLFLSSFVTVMYNIYLKMSKLRKKSSPWITYICRQDTAKGFVRTSQEQQPCRKARHTQ